MSIGISMGGTFSMRILAAAFESPAAAAGAFDVLGRRFAGGRNLEMAPLGRAGDPTAPTTVVAGEFADDVIDAVAKVVAKYGGTVVADVDERFTRS